MARTPKAAQPRRRLRGEGTLFKQTRTITRNGVAKEHIVWRAVLSTGYVSENGRRTRKRKFFTAPTAARARAARDAYLATIGKAAPAPSETPTVEEYAAHFLENAATRTRATTRRSYAQVLKHHITPYIGKVCLGTLTRDHILTMYDQVRRKVSPSMAARVHVTLRAMLNLSLEEGLMTFSPIASIRHAAPRHKPPRVEALDYEGTQAILKAAKGHRLEALFVVALTTGMRQGEIFGLRWCDIDRERRTLSVTRSAQEVDGAVAFVAPKTDSSRRRVALSQVAVAALERRREIAATEGHKSELVFPSERGYPLRKSNFIRRVWHPIRKAAGAPTLRFHALRHTAASLLLAENVSPKVVQEMGGWSTIKIVLDTYSHLIPTMQSTAADAFDRVLGSATQQVRGGA